MNIWCLKKPEVRRFTYQPLSCSMIWSFIIIASLDLRLDEMCSKFLMHMHIFKLIDLIEEITKYDKLEFLAPCANKS